MFGMSVRAGALLCALFAFAPVAAQAQTVFGTKNERKQCRAIEPWFEEMQRAVGADVLHKGEPGTSEQYGWLVRKLVAPMFMDEKFAPVFGKPYFQMATGDTWTASRAFARCVSRMGSAYYVHDALKNVNPRNEMGKAVAAAMADSRSPEIQIAEARQAYDEEQRVDEARRVQRTEDRARRQSVANTPKHALPHRAGKLLLETAEVRIHEYRLTSHDVDALCNARSTVSYSLSVVIKNRSTVVDPAWMDRLLRDTLAPLTGQNCANVRQINGYVFFDGVHLARDGSLIDVFKVTSSATSIEKEFARVSATLSDGAIKSDRKVYFREGFGEVSAEYHTLSGLRELAARDFLPVDAYVERNAERKRIEDRLAAVGVRIDTEEVRVLVLGDKDANDYYWRYRTSGLTAGRIVRVALGYSSIMRGQCPRATPGGMSVLNYTETRNGYVQTNTDIAFPSDFSDVIVRIVNGGGLPALPASDEVKADLQRLVDRHGCSSGLMRQVHARITNAMRNTTFYRSNDQRPDDY